VAWRRRGDRKEILAITWLVEDVMENGTFQGQVVGERVKKHFWRPCEGERSAEEVTVIARHSFNFYQLLVVTCKDQ
jgi:hypothetical protein